MQETAKRKRSAAARNVLPGDNLAEFFVHLVASLWTALVNWIPLGYQDETGFHFGPEPRPGFRFHWFT